MEFEDWREGRRGGKGRRVGRERRGGEVGGKIVIPCFVMQSIDVLRFLG